MMQSEVRTWAQSVLKSLQQEVEETSGPCKLWASQEIVPHDCVSFNCRFLNQVGFLLVPEFASKQECAAMKLDIFSMVQNEWNLDFVLDSFGTNKAENESRGDYFLESADRVHFFAEPDSLEIVTTDAGEQRRLKPEYEGNKLAALNKVGHGLHLRKESSFGKYSHSEKLRELVADLGWKDAVLPQSMYIFKQAKTGGAVNSHQDSSFLFTAPRQTCLGLWLALDDSTLENGCLWIRPKSHKEAVRRQYQRNMAHFGVEKEERGDVKVDPTQPKFIMKDLYDYSKEIPWEGGLPSEGDWKGLLEAGFIPIECQIGDLLCFVGELDHLSLPNLSEFPRHTYQLHLVEGPSESVAWSGSNWLQYPPGKPFPSLR